MSKPTVTAYNTRPDTFIFSSDCRKKVNLATSVRLADRAWDHGISRLGDNCQLWRSKSGVYFRGTSLEHAFDYGPRCYCFVPMTKYEAFCWTMKYYGPEFLKSFGLDDTAEANCVEI